MIKQVLSLCFLLLVLLSCKDDITRMKKKDMIPREDFVDILVNIHLIDAITEDGDFYGKYRKSDSIKLYENIFKKHNVTKAEFDTTVNMYVRQPDVYKNVYDEVLLKLNFILDTLQNNDPKFSREELKKRP